MKSKPTKAKKVVKHLKGDIKTFKHEIKEDKELISSLKKKRISRPTRYDATPEMTAN